MCYVVLENKQSELQAIGLGLDVLLLIGQVKFVYLRFKELISW